MVPCTSAKTVGLGNHIFTSHRYKICVTVSLPAECQHLSVIVKQPKIKCTKKFEMIAR